jgi:hypothetical protein
MVKIARLMDTTDGFWFRRRSEVAQAKGPETVHVDQSCRNMSPIISRLENPEVLDVRRAPRKFKAQGGLHVLAT